MIIRRHFLLATLSALALSASAVYAQDNILRVGTDATFPPPFVASPPPKCSLWSARICAFYAVC